ncbi:histone H2B.2 [Prunus persica]|nr:histone H2B.2 [Prunus persica]
MLEDPLQKSSPGKFSSKIWELGNVEFLLLQSKQHLHFQIHFLRGKEATLLQANIGPLLSKMAPKRSTKTVVKTTKQVVRETVQVSSVVQSKRRKKQSEDSGDQTRKPVKTIKTISIETQEENQTQNVEISEPLKTRRIPIQTEEENQILKGQNAEAITTLTSDQKEAAAEEEEEGEGEKKEDQEDTVETSITSDEKEDEQKSEEVKTLEGEKEDSMETNTTSDEREEEEEETTKKEEHKSDEVKTQKGGKKSSEKKRKRKRRERGRGEEYKIYVHRVLKQVHPGMGVSSKGMTVLNNLMNDMFERLADEAARLTKYTARKTLSSREIQAAVKLVLPGELGRHAMAEGTKAVSTYVSNNNGRQSKS